MKIGKMGESMYRAGLRILLMMSKVKKDADVRGKEGREHTFLPGGDNDQTRAGSGTAGWMARLRNY